jgi:uncharacterized protein YutE (UPF0331/DUF86 family)
MSRELILKKVEQLKELLAELARLLETPLKEFADDLKTIRAAERNFELIVEVASDINTQMLLDTGKKTPDSDKQSFTELKRADIVPEKLAKQLVTSAKLRNILVHEYDFEEDYEKFYTSAKAVLPAYEEYIQAILAHLPK